MDNSNSKNASQKSLRCEILIVYIGSTCVQLRQDEIKTGAGFFCKFFLKKYFLCPLNISKNCRECCSELQHNAAAKLNFNIDFEPKSLFKTKALLISTGNAKCRCGDVFAPWLILIIKMEKWKSVGLNFRIVKCSIEHIHFWHTKTFKNYEIPSILVSELKQIQNQFQLGNIYFYDFQSIL